MAELRTMTVALEFKGQTGITGVKQFTAAITDADAAVDKLTAELGENAKVTIENVKSEKELTAQTRLLLRQMESTAKNVDDVTRHYKLLESQIGKTAQEQEVLNAVMRLGPNATEAQRRQVTELVQNYQNMAGAAQGSFRQLRGASQQLGWQLQDVAVQAQMGTSAFVIFSQQGSQLAAAFGPAGALVGALIAVGGALGGVAYKAYTAEVSTKELTDATTQLGTVLDSTENGVNGLAEALVRLAQKNELAARSQISLAMVNAKIAAEGAQQAINKASESMDSWLSAKGDITDAGIELANMEKITKRLGVTSQEVLSGNVPADALRRVERLRTYINRLGNDYGLTQKEALSFVEATAEFNKQPTTENATKLASVMQNVAETSSDVSREFVKLTAEVSTNANKMIIAKQNSEDLKSARDNLAKSLEEESSSIKTQNRLLVDSYRLQSLSGKQKALAAAEQEKLELTTKQKKLSVEKRLSQEELALAIKYIDEKAQKEIDKIDEAEKKKEETKKKAAERSAKTEQDKIARQKAMDDRALEAQLLSLVKQTESIDQEYARRKAIIDKYVAKRGENQNTALAYAQLEEWRTQKLTEETDKQIKEFQRRETARQQIEKGQNTRLSGVGGNLDNEKAKYEANLRLLTNQDSQVERELTRHLAALKTQRDNGKLTGDMYDMNVQKANQDALAEQARINALKEGEEERHTKAMADFQLQIYSAQLQSIASAATIMSSITDLMSTGIEDVKAKTAEMNAFQKTMFLISQSIAAASALINGISLGSKLAEMFPLAAPAMITLGTSLGAAQAGAIMGTTFAGTFDNGGTIPAGQSGIVSEYGDELVNGVMVKGPARVTSREDTAKMMNGGGGSVSILIENRIDGASYREERIDENTVKIIAEKVFNQNIDSGVSSVLGNRNSKSTKQLKSNFSVKGKY